MSPFNPQQQNPNQIMRSKMFSISTATYFMCNLSYTQAYLWTLNKINSGVTQLKDLSANPTFASSEIVIESNTLEYGLYEFTIQVEIKVLSSVLKSKVSTFVEIIPTGLVVFGLENGIQSISIGFSQALVLNPIKYSFDFDNMASISNLSFKFYCSPISNYNYIGSSLSDTGDKDLATFKRNSSLKMSPCFTSNG
jgi:hypothetical protein